MNRLLLVITLGMDGPHSCVVSETDFRAKLAAGEYGEDPDLQQLQKGDSLDFMSGEERVIVTEYRPYPEGLEAAEDTSPQELQQQVEALATELDTVLPFAACTVAHAGGDAFNVGLTSSHGRLNLQVVYPFEAETDPEADPGPHQDEPNKAHEQEEPLTIEEVVGAPLVDTEEVSAGLTVPMSELGTFKPVSKGALRSSFETAEEFPPGHLNTCMNELDYALKLVAPQASVGIEHLSGHILSVKMRYNSNEAAFEVLCPPPPIMESYVNMKAVRKLELYSGTVRPQGLSEPEPPPAAGQTDVWPLVIEDMRERDQEGRRKYGTALQTHNGRRPLVDAYQELLDLVVYLRQEIEERKAGRD